jgi:hypothetical protein
MHSADSKSLAGHGKCFLRRADAAAYVTDRYGFPCSRQWLAKLAVVGGGPVSARPDGIRSINPATSTSGRRRGSGRCSIQPPTPSHRSRSRRLRTAAGAEQWE